MTEKKPFKFEDLAKLTDREIQMLLREVDTRDLAVALVGARPAVQKAIYGNVSKRVEGLVKEHIGKVKSAGHEPSPEAGKLLVEIVEKLREAGLVVWPRARRKPKSVSVSKDHRQTRKDVRALLRQSPHDLSLDELTRLFVGLDEIARMEGILALDSYLARTKDDFVKTGLQHAVDGTEPALIQGILESWMASRLHDHAVRYRRVIEGVMSVQSGDNPRICEQKLNVIY